MQRQAETEQLRERSALQAELLSADVDPVLYLPDYGAAVDRYTGGERAFALFSDSGVLAYSAMPQQVQLAWQLALLDADSGMLRTAADGSRWYLIADRIPVRETAVYYVGAYPMDTAYNTQAMLLASYFWIELAVFAAAGLAVWFMIHRLTRPLRALDAASRQIAAGDYARRTALPGSDEIAALSRSFDHMADALQAELDSRALAVRQREDFISALSHELKTPMTSILGYAQLLRTEGADPELRERAAGYIAHEARRLESLSRKLLDLMQVTRGTVTLGPVPLSALLTALRRAPAPKQPAAGRPRAGGPLHAAGRRRPAVRPAAQPGHQRGAGRPQRRLRPSGRDGGGRPGAVCGVGHRPGHPAPGPAPPDRAVLYGGQVPRPRRRRQRGGPGAVPGHRRGPRHRPCL